MKTQDSMKDSQLKNLKNVYLNSLTQAQRFSLQIAPQVKKDNEYYLYSEIPQHKLKDPFPRLL